ncbi:MAG: type II secretion system protein [Eubacteriales bacterium]|nr:type II secretion system protein [Eubacteriales bacterium]
MTKKNKRRGFTIVELVIVIAVIAILAAVLIPTYANLVKKANEAKAQAEAKNLVTEMLANILSGGDDAADLIIVTKKGNEAYVHGYDASAGQLVAYKDNPVTIPEGADFYAQAKNICDAMVTAKKLNTVAVTEGSWRDSEKLKANMASLGFKAEETAVFANYDIVSLTQNVTVVKTADNLKMAIEGGGYVIIKENVDVAPIVSDKTVNTLVPQTTIQKDTTMDLSGKKIGIYVEDGAADPFGKASPVIITVNSGTLTINGDGEINCEAGNNQVYGINVLGGKVVVNSGKFYGAMTAIQVQKGELEINGGFFDMAPTCKAQVPQYAKYVVNCIDANYKNGTAKITIRGGTFVNFDPSADPEGAGTSYVANGYKVLSETQANGDVWYTVVAGN